MFKRLLQNIKEQKGFTFVELLVSIAIAGIIAGVIIATTFQIFAVSSSDGNRMEAVKQVENALHWINRDAQMADPDSIPVTGNFSPDYPLNLRWKDYTDTDNGQPTHNVTYSVESNVMTRQDVITGNSTKTTNTKIADYIDLSKSNFSFDGTLLTINLTSFVEGFRSAEETRNFHVRPRLITPPATP